MAFLHSHEVLHRCLIPHNILIGEHFNAKLSDFVSIYPKCMQLVTPRKSFFFTKNTGPVGDEAEKQFLQ